MLEELRRRLGLIPTAPDVAPAPPAGPPIERSAVVRSYRDVLARRRAFQDLRRNRLEVLAAEQAAAEATLSRILVERVAIGDELDAAIRRNAAGEDVEAFRLALAAYPHPVVDRALERVEALTAEAPGLRSEAALRMLKGERVFTNSRECVEYSHALRAAPQALESLRVQPLDEQEIAAKAEQILADLTSKRPVPPKVPARWADQVEWYTGGPAAR